MSKFQTGHIKMGGKVKGTPNKTSEEVRQSLLKLLADNLETLQKDIEGMKSKDRAYLLINLAKHVTPPAMNPERLTEEQLQQILQYLKDEINTKTGN
jgi:hypothetical protein